MPTYLKSKKLSNLMLNVNKINKNSDSVDTQCKIYNRAALELSKDNSYDSLNQASKLYEEVWKMLTTSRGAHHTRTLTAYMNYYNIQERVSKARQGKINTQKRNKDKEKENKKNKIENLKVKFDL